MCAATKLPPMKVDDIRPSEAMADQAQAVQADIDWLGSRREAFVKVACPACQRDDPEYLYDKYAMSHQCCRHCGAQYVSPRPGEEMLGDFYRNSENYHYWAIHIFPKSAEARRRLLFRPRAEQTAALFADRALDNGTLIEIGAAHGLYCDEVRKLGLFSRIVAIEPTPDLAAECRRLGLETIEAPFEQADLEAEADVVANFEVIEHLFDPAAFLSWSRSLLKPGGFVFLTCPNVEGFETLLLGRDSDTVDHEHLNLFTPSSLELLAERSGFINIKVETPGELDVEIVQQALKDDRIDEGRLGPVLTRLLTSNDTGVAGGLQNLLADAGLSSHMRLVAQRPEQD